MKIAISLDSGSPIYLQIFRQVQHLVGTQRLRKGEELPSIRSLASQLVVNPNTVARAYRELEAAGVVIKRGTAGTFVADSASALSERQRKESLVRQVEALLVNAREMGFSAKDVLKEIRDLDSLHEQKERQRQ